MSGGECQTKNTKNYEEEEKDKPIVALDEGLTMLHEIEDVIVTYDHH